jgi:hypothetical protein
MIRPVMPGRVRACAAARESVKSWLKLRGERPITNVDLPTQEHTHEG